MHFHHSLDGKLKEVFSCSSGEAFENKLRYPCKIISLEVALTQILISKLIFFPYSYEHIRDLFLRYFNETQRAKGVHLYSWHLGDH